MGDDEIFACPMSVQPVHAEKTEVRTRKSYTMLLPAIKEIRMK